MKNKIGKNLLKTILICFGIILLGIVITGIFSYNEIIYSFNPIILTLAIILYVVLIIALYKKVIPKLEKIKYVEWLLFILFTIFAVIIALCLEVVSSTGDMMILFGFAKKFVVKGSFSEAGYLSVFPHNTMQVVIEAIVLMVASSIGIIADLTVITIFTALVVSSSVFISFFVIKKISSRKNALMFLIICLFTTPLYMYSALYYTDSFSMPIAPLLLYIWLVINETNSTKRKFILKILFGIVLFIGYEIKLTSIFVFIAIFVYELLKGNAKELLKKVVLIIPTTIICVVLFNIFVVDRIVPKEKRYTNEVPKEHWIMMGMEGVGNYSLKEYFYTFSFETYPEKQQAIRKKIVDRLTQRDISIHIENLGLKLEYAWHDGTYYGPVNLKTTNYKKNMLHNIIFPSGEYNEFYKYVPQTMHFAMLLFIAINSIRIIKEKKYESKDIICIITMFGVMVFLLIWENRSRYLVSNLLLMIMAQVNGIEYLSSKIKKIKITDKKQNV